MHLFSGSRQSDLCKKNEPAPADLNKFSEFIVLPLHQTNGFC